jgi:NAD kinase
MDMMTTMMCVQQSTSSLATATLKWTSDIQHVLVVAKRWSRAVLARLEAFLKKLLAIEPPLMIHLPKTIYAKVVSASLECDRLQPWTSAARTGTDTGTTATHVHGGGGGGDDGGGGALPTFDAKNDIDLVISFGGDNAVMAVAHKFQGLVPPTMAITPGSQVVQRGFLTPFTAQPERQLERDVETVLHGASPVTLRMRPVTHWL